MNNINVIRKMKIRLKTIKPVKDKYGTKTKNLDLTDYALYALLRNKKNKDDCCHDIKVFNNYIENSLHSLNYEIKRYKTKGSEHVFYYKRWDMYSIEELSEILDIVENYIKSINLSEEINIE